MLLSSHCQMNTRDEFLISSISSTLAGELIFEAASRSEADLVVTDLVADMVVLSVVVVVVAGAFVASSETPEQRPLVSLRVVVAVVGWRSAGGDLAKTGGAFFCSAAAGQFIIVALLALMLRRSLGLGVARAPGRRRLGPGSR